MSFFRRWLMVKEVDPDQQLTGVYPDRTVRQQVYRDMYSCEYDPEPFIMYRIKKNLVRCSWSTDGKGFVRVTHAPGPAPLRVLLLGDSVTFGLGLSHTGENIASQLEKALLERSDVRERGLSVINCSQPGYSLLQQVLYSRYFLSGEDVPDIVLLWCGFNDVHNAFYSPDFGGPIPLLDPCTPAVRRLGRMLLKLLPAAFLKLMMGSELATRVHSDKRRLGRRFADDKYLYVTLFADFKARWEREGARVMVLLQPYLGGGNRSLTPCEQVVLAKRRALIGRQFALDVLSVYADAYRRFEEWLKEAGCDCLNLVDVLDAQTGQMFVDRVHLTPRAIETIAQRVARAVLESGRRIRMGER